MQSLFCIGECVVLRAFSGCGFELFGAVCVSTSSMFSESGGLGGCIYICFVHTLSLNFSCDCICVSMPYFNFGF